MCNKKIPIYTILELSEFHFKIERYNYKEGQREVLSNYGELSSREEAKAECDKLNHEAFFPNQQN